MIALLQNKQNEIKSALNLRSILYFLWSSNDQTPWSCVTSEWSQNVALDRNKLNTGQTCYNSETLQTNTVASFPMTCSTSFLLRLTQFLFDTSHLFASPALLPTHKEPPSLYTVSIIYALMLFALSWVIFRNLLTGLVRHAKLFKKNTVFPRIIAGGDYFFFRTKRGRLFEVRRLFEGGD